MRVALMPHVEDKLVFGQVEHAVYRHGQFDIAQIGSKVSAVFRDRAKYHFPQFGAKRIQFFFGTLFDVRGRIDFFDHIY